jgi:hypothetical protein
MTTTMCWGSAQGRRESTGNNEGGTGVGEGFEKRIVERERTKILANHESVSNV